jgi:hypothetical protein
MASDKVSGYFACRETKFANCCKDCKYATCIENCVKGSDCKSGRGTFDIACPRQEFEDTGFASSKMVNATFRFKNEDGFWKDLGETWGIDKSWVSFGKRRVQYSNGCQNAGTRVNECIAEANDWWYDYPRANDNIEIYK